MSVLTTPVGDDQLVQLIEQLGQLPTYSIGRAGDNTIVITNAKISGHHARLIQCTLTSFVLEDLDSKNGTFVNGARVTRKVIGQQDTLRLADTDYAVQELMGLRTGDPVKPASVVSSQPEPPTPTVQLDKIKPDYSREFTALKSVFEQYPELRRACRNRDKMIRTGSVLLSTVVGISTVLVTGGGAAPVLALQMLSGAGLSVLVPTLCSTFLSTEEKLEVLDKEYRERYRCPNPDCRDPFGTREWDQLAQQKACRRCEAIWIK